MGPGFPPGSGSSCTLELSHQCSIPQHSRGPGQKAKDTECSRSKGLSVTSAQSWSLQQQLKRWAERVGSGTGEVTKTWICLLFPRHSRQFPQESLGIVSSSSCLEHFPGHPHAFTSSDLFFLITFSVKSSPMTCFKLRPPPCYHAPYLLYFFL